MTASFTDNLKQRFAGDLSEGERQVCASFRDLLHAAVSGQIGFRDAISGLWSGLAAVREFHYDVEKAIASGTFDPTVRRKVTTLREGAFAPTPLTGAERTFLEDADGLIDWSTRNGVSFSVVLQILGHDVSELARDDFHLEKTLGPGRCVTPKVTGWANRNAEPVGEADEQM